ncbi:MAG: hypothetical protein ACE5HE_13015 [Phycisphaerae bacterium]
MHELPYRPVLPVLRRALRAAGVLAIVAVAGPAPGCGSSLPEPASPLFVVPLSVEGESVGSALVDTGGGYEVMLRRDYGLKIVDSTEVIVFGGIQTVDITESFSYTAGGVSAVAESAIVGASVCGCNGVGFHFFRKTGVVLGLDFAQPAVVFLAEVPPGSFTIDFDPLPEERSTFDTSFIGVEVELDGASQNLIGLLDTGANATVLRSDLAGGWERFAMGSMVATITHPVLGSVSVHVRLSSNRDLPDIILGTDAMSKWADQWYFSFRARGGSFTVVRDGGSFTPADAQPPL